LLTLLASLGLLILTLLLTLLPLALLPLLVLLALLTLLSFKVICLGRRRRRCRRRPRRWRWWWRSCLFLRAKNPTKAAGRTISSGRPEWSWCSYSTIGTRLDAALGTLSSFILLALSPLWQRRNLRRRRFGRGRRVELRLGLRRGLYRRS